MKALTDHRIPFTTPKGRKIHASYLTWPKTAFNVAVSLDYQIDDVPTHSLFYVEIYKLPHPFPIEELPINDICQGENIVSDELISKCNHFIEQDFPNMLAKADQAIDALITHLS